MICHPSAGHIVRWWMSKIAKYTYLVVAMAPITLITCSNLTPVSPSTCTLYVSCCSQIPDTFTWMRLHPSGQAPSPRRAHVSVIWKQQLYIFGGGDGVRALNDVHVYDIKSNTWSAVETYGVKPERRGYHTGTLVGDRLVIYGGSDGHTCFGDVHVLDLASHHWYPVAVEPPVSRLSHASVCVGSYLFVTGGHDGSRYCNELLMLNFGMVNTRPSSTDSPILIYSDHGLGVTQNLRTSTDAAWIPFVGPLR